MELLGKILPKPPADFIWRFEFTPACRAAYTRLLLDRAEAPPDSRNLLITGVMLSLDPEHRITGAFLQSGGTITSCSMEHDSPGLAKLHPDLAHASRSRFRIEIRLDEKTADTVALGGITPSGKSIDWLTIRREKP